MPKSIRRGLLALALGAMCVAPLPEATASVPRPVVEMAPMEVDPVWLNLWFRGLTPARGHWRDPAEMCEDIARHYRENGGWNWREAYWEPVDWSPGCQIRAPHYYGTNRPGGAYWPGTEWCGTREGHPVGVHVTVEGRTRCRLCPAGYRMVHGYERCLAEPGEPSEEKGLGACPYAGAPLLANPVHPATGNKLQVELDYAGAGPAPLRFERTYNSRPRAAEVATRSRWTHTYARRIELRGAPGAAIRTAAAHRPDGRVLHFNEAPDGSWLADADRPERLLALHHPQGGWTLTDAEDTVEGYDAAGRLLTLTLGARGSGSACAHQR